MPDYWLKFLGGASKVNKYISLAPLWHGTSAAGPPAQMGAAFPNPLDTIGPALGEMGTGSAFMTKMRAGGVAVPGVKYVNIMTKYDELVQPYTSGSEPGMTNIVIQDRCPQDYTEHFEIAADKNASVLVLNALDPAHPRPLVCSLVLPFVGGL
jgi:triacylglycerol lipase